VRRDERERRTLLLGLEIGFNEAASVKFPVKEQQLFVGCCGSAFTGAAGDESSRGRTATGSELDLESLMRCCCCR